MLHRVKPLKPTIAQILRFFRLLEDKDLRFEAMNAARCALSIILPRIDGETVGQSTRGTLQNRNTAGSGKSHKFSTFLSLGPVIRIYPLKISMLK